MAAVAVDDRRHALADEFLKDRIREHEDLFVRVGIDEAGTDVTSSRVDRLSRGAARNLADVDDSSVANSNRRAEGRPAGAIDDPPAANDDVERRTRHLNRTQPAGPPTTNADAPPHNA